MLSLDRQNRFRDRYRHLRQGWQPATELFADLVRARLTPTSRVLDLGCGRGGLIEQLNHPLRQTVGLDPDWQSLADHRLNLPRVVGLSGRLPFAAHSFDLIFASWLLEHLPQPQADFAEMGRVLKPGGVFVFITPNGRHPLSRLNALLGRFSPIQGRLVQLFYGRAAADAFPTHYRANSAGQLRQLATASGLALATLETIPDPSYLAFNEPLFRLMCWFEGWLPADRRLHLVGVLQRVETA